MLSVNRHHQNRLYLSRARGKKTHKDEKILKLLIPRTSDKKDPTNSKIIYGNGASHPFQPNRMYVCVCSEIISTFGLTNGLTSIRNKHCEKNKLESTGK